MLIKILIVFILAAFLLLSAAFIAGCYKHRFHSQSPEKKAEWVVKKISSELDLDDNQKANIDQIKSEILAKHKNFSEVKSEIWTEVNKQVKKEKIDEEKLNALFTAKESQFKELRTFSIRKFAEFHAMLTPEQRAELADKMTNFQNKWPH